MTATLRPGVGHAKARAAVVHQPTGRRGVVLFATVHTGRVKVRFVHPTTGRLTHSWVRAEHCSVIDTPTQGADQCPTASTPPKADRTIGPAGR